MLGQSREPFKQIRRFTSRGEFKAHMQGAKLKYSTTSSFLCECKLCYSDSTSKNEARVHLMRVKYAFCRNKACNSDESHACTRRYKIFICERTSVGDAKWYALYAAGSHTIEKLPPNDDEIEDEKEEVEKEEEKHFHSRCFALLMRHLAKFVVGRFTRMPVEILDIFEEEEDEHVSLALFNDFVHEHYAEKIQNICAKQKRH